MTVERDVSAAAGAVRKAMAAALARKEQAEAALTNLRSAVTGRREDLALAEEAGEQKLVGDVQRLIDDLEGQVALQEEVIATADTDLAQMNKELSELEREASRVGVVLPTVGPDRPAHESTLDRVRASIDEMSAVADLNDELSGRPTPRRTELTDDDARAKLAALKAARAPRADAAGGADAPSDDPPKKKRTL